MSKAVKNEKQALVPRLRFPEFQDAGDWEIKPFGKLFTIGNGRDHKHLSSGDIPVYGSGGYMRSVNDFLYNGESVCIGRKGTIDNPVFLSGKFWTVDTLFYTHSFKGCLPRFIFSLFQNIDWHKHNEAGGVPSLSKTNISKIEVAIPTVSEQQKIADCLSSLDALIAAQAEKIDALKTHKKGLMQQLFPREGETVPRLRFPEFRNAGEWGFKKAKVLFSSRVEQGQDGLPICSVTMNDGVAKRDSLDRKIDDISQSSGNKKAYEHDIVYNMMRMWQGASGVAVEDCMVSPAYVVLAPSDSVCSKFFGYLFKLPQFLQVLTAHSQGLTKDRLRLYFKDFAKIPLPNPPVVEQQRIADCLSSLDALIAAQADKLDTLKAHKIGLMQQFFPGPEAVGA